MDFDDECDPERCWKGNAHWMRRGGEPEPTHDPPETGCESCGWLDGTDTLTLGVWDSDLMWAPPGTIAWTKAGQWLCMECD